MSIDVESDIGLEMHPDVDQFIRIEQGEGLSSWETALTIWIFGAGLAMTMSSLYLLESGIT